MSVDRSDELVEWYDEDNPDGAALLDAVVEWLERFIATPHADDLRIVAVWTAHTYLVVECYTTPRLQIDSVMYGSGKTTLLDHLAHLCFKPLLAASLSSPALIPRVLEVDMRTILLDEVDRNLHPDRPGVNELLPIINNGYRLGATRPTLVPIKGGGWESVEMPIYAPVAMAGNAPNLPADTVSRCIRILLSPDLHGTVEDSDWEHIGADAKRMAAAIAVWADNVRADVKAMKVTLPKGCIGRSREKWRPLKRIAVAAGGHWPDTVDRLVLRSLAEDAAVQEAGLMVQPPAMVLLADLYRVWPEGDYADLMTSDGLISLLVDHNPSYWGEQSAYGKRLTWQRMGKLLSQAAKITTVRPGGGNNPRGYLRSQFVPVWQSLKIAPTTPVFKPDEPATMATLAADNPNTADVANVSNTSGLKTDPPTTQCNCGRPAPVNPKTGLCTWCELAASKQTDNDRTTK